jgi:hypothetical protein
MRHRPATWASRNRLHIDAILTTAPLDGLKLFKGRGRGGKAGGQVDVKHKLEILEAPLPFLPQDAGAIDHRVDPVGTAGQGRQVARIGHISPHELGAIRHGAFLIKPAGKTR